MQSSKQLLLALSGMFLCGEGDVVKHLRLLGYTLHHIQVGGAHLLSTFVFTHVCVSCIASTG